MRNHGIPVVVLLSALLLPACHDSNDPVRSPPETPVFGVWDATVVEVEDTCDDLVPPDLPVSVDVEPFDVRHMVRFRDYGAGLNCWIQVFEVDGDVLSWRIGYDADLDCNPGCRIHLDSHVEFVFDVGGRFSGVETVTYEPLTPECNVPACMASCPDPVDHMLWETRMGRGCGFGCTTTYHWDGRLEGAVDPMACEG